MITLKLVDPWETSIEASYDHSFEDLENILLTKLEGWTGGVSVKGETMSRATHGDFPIPNLRTGRTLTVGMHADRDSRASLWALERGVSGLFSDGGFGTLTVQQDDQKLWCPVELDGEVKTTVNVDGGFIDIEIPLASPEPWLYSDWRTSMLRPLEAGIGLEYGLFTNGFASVPQGSILTYGTQVSTNEWVWNDGNAKSFPKFIVYADAPGGFRVSLGDRTIAYPRPTFMSTPVEVDMSGSVIVSGFDQSQYLTERNWAPVDPHSIETPKFELLQGGTGWCEVQHRDTYI